MKIAVSFPSCNRRGGIERIVLETVNFLASRGNDVHLCACRWDTDLLDRRVTTHSIAPGRGPSPLPAISFARRSRPAVAAVTADMTAAFGVYCPPGAVLWAGSVHRAWLDTSRRQRNFTGRLRQKLNPFHPVMLAFERYYFGGRRYRKLIAYTEQVKSDFMRFYNVPEKDITIIPCGFSPTEFSLARRAELRAATRARLNYADSDKVILFVANELHRKGFGTLLCAWAKDARPNERLLAVGRFNPAGFISDIQSLGLADRVRFEGSANNVAEFYSAADLFAMPTQYEPWGLVIVESLACGLPVLTSRLAGASVAVQHGTTGQLLDDPTDVDEVSAKLRILLDAPPNDPEVIANSVRDYAWPSVLGKYENLLMEVA